LLFTSASTQKYGRWLPERLSNSKPAKFPTDLHSLNMIVCEQLMRSRIKLVILFFKGLCRSIKLISYRTEPSWKYALLEKESVCSDPSGSVAYARLTVVSTWPMVLSDTEELSKLSWEFLNLIALRTRATGCSESSSHTFM